MRSLAVIGGGRAAWAMATLARQAGIRIAGVALRIGSASPIADDLRVVRSDLPDLPGRFDSLLVAVPDDRIQSVYEALRARIPVETIVFHPSGIVPSAVLDGHARRFALHPLRSLPPAGTGIDFRGTLFVFEGMPGTRGVAERLATAAGGTLAAIDPDSKAAYHSAAVLASSCVAVLLEIARDEMRRAGVESALEEPLARLARSAIDNWMRGGRRFTGPIARGDTAVIERHLEALHARVPRGDLYRLLAVEICNAILADDAEQPELRALRDRLVVRHAP